LSISLLDRYLANTVITYPVRTGNLTIDLGTGDEVEQLGAPLILRAYLKEAPTTFRNRSVDTERPAGVNSTGLFVIGRLTNPATFAAVGVFQIEYTQPLVTVIDGVPGRLLLTPSIEKAAVSNAGYLPKLGQSLNGWFEFTPI
jgi:hypothetical protein